jgi:hypothetical protein
MKARKLDIECYQMALLEEFPLTTSDARFSFSSQFPNMVILSCSGGQGAIYNNINTIFFNIEEFPQRLKSVSTLFAEKLEKIRRCS